MYIFSGCVIMRRERIYAYIHTQKLRKISGLILYNGPYKTLLRGTFLAPNTTSAPLQTTLAADAHLAEGQFLHEQLKIIIIIIMILCVNVRVRFYVCKCCMNWNVACPT
jgi:hypothetical protein